MKRSGLSLLEVVLALAIFLFSLAAISQLIHFGSLRALDIHYQHKAQMLCQTKLAEVQAGIEPLQEAGFSLFANDPDWEWRLDAKQAEVANLWNVTVAVRGMGREDEVAVYQWILDPSKRGSTLDKPGGTQ